MRISDRSSDVCSSDLVEERAIDLVAAERGERQRRHELGAGGGQDAAHRGVLLLQPPDQLERLVGGDASRDDQENPFSGQHGGLAQISRWTDVNNLGVRQVDRKSVVLGKSVSVRLDIGGGGINKKK